MFTATLYAQGAAQAQAGGSPLVSIGMMVVIFAIFYFLLIRPQKQQQKKLAQSIAELKKGDKIIVSGATKFFICNNADSNPEFLVAKIIRSA